MSQTTISAYGRHQNLTNMSMTASHLSMLLHHSHPHAYGRPSVMLHGPLYQPLRQQMSLQSFQLPYPSSQQQSLPTSSPLLMNASQSSQQQRQSNFTPNMYTSSSSFKNIRQANGYSADAFLGKGRFS
uniref:Uncharacterized protein n=1 Tax=Lygus hesperus TaxID=30085 RepID=A0A146M9L5_LYGHE